MGSRLGKVETPVRDPTHQSLRLPKLPLTYKIIAFIMLVAVMGAMVFGVYQSIEARKQSKLAAAYKQEAHNVHLDSLTIETQLEAALLAQKSAEDIAKRLNEIAKEDAENPAPITVLKAGETFTADKDILLLDPKVAARAGVKVAKYSELKEKLAGCRVDLVGKQTHIDILGIKLVRVKSSRVVWAGGGFLLGTGVTIGIMSLVN